jgi:ferrochelatase
MRTIVLLGFGGPAKPDEIRPFLDRVLQGRPVPPERIELVVDHYMRIGGKSPFNELTQRQADSLAAELESRRMHFTVRTAYLNAAPFVADVVTDLANKNVERPIAIILAAHQSPASWDKYMGLIPGAVYVPPYYEHPLFVRANADRLREALERLGKSSFEETEVIFTAHSIPQAMADASPYATQLHRSAELIAQQAGVQSWRIAYQSRSGLPAEKWLEPDVRDALRDLGRERKREAIVVPIGFLCDHVEVLYDLDIDAANVAREAGVRMERAPALNDHPLFIRMLADLVAACA